MSKRTKATRNNPNPDYIPPMNRGKASDDANLVPRMCPNCGAPVCGSECEYCGTVFERNGGYELVEIHLAHDADAVARSLRRFNPMTGTYGWVAENPAKAVRTPHLLTKHGRG